MTIQEFKQRLEWNNGPDRQLGRWLIIDIHQISMPMLEQHEIDFYCCNHQAVYLLRLRNREQGNYYISPPTEAWDTLTYLIAERPITLINDTVIEEVLEQFDLQAKV